jgi:hypothetical protein
VRLCSVSQALSLSHISNTPNQMREPPGTIVVTEATYTALDDRRVPVEGSRFEPADQHTNKLEGSAITGYETMSIAGGVFLTPTGRGPLRILLRPCRTPGGQLKKGGYV